MIKKLRRKLIAVIMGVVTLIIASAFISILVATTHDIERNNSLVLRDAIMQVSHPKPQGGFAPAGRAPTLVAIQDSTGNIEILYNQMQYVDIKEVPAVFEKAVSSGKTSGVINSYSLNYLVEQTVQGQTVIAFTDTTMQKGVIRNLLVNSALIGVSTLLIFFIASIFLARWVVRPVEKAWNSQRQFIADASHELKTPLTVILSNGEILTGDGGIEDAKTKTRLENIFEEAKCMKVLLDDMLSLARSEGVAHKVPFERIDFSMLVNNSALIFEPVFFDAGKRFEYHIKEALNVTGDAVKLRQLIEILLDNALKYAVPDGLVTVSLKSISKNDVCLEVTNACETIPKEELSRIFERFYRLDKSRSSSGYGLGLAIAENIVREHGGKIWAKSEGGYITFCITLPAER